MNSVPIKITNISFFLKVTILNFFPIILFSQSPDIEWQKCLAGSDAKTILQTSEGGFIVAGTGGANIKGFHGGQGSDAWVAKLDPLRNVVWQKCYGGKGDDLANSILMTGDGGYIFAGLTNSNDGDVAGIHGGLDAWVVKLDATGNIQWQKCIGGKFGEEAYSISRTFDGSYILAGSTNSWDGDVSGHSEGLVNSDIWIVKLDTLGNILWQKCYGGTRDDHAYSIIQTNDTGYIFAGQTSSADGDVTGYHSPPDAPPNFWSDAWVVKISSSGNLEWEKCIGGSLIDGINDIIQTSDGGYAAVGTVESNDGNIIGHHDNPGHPDDGLVIKLDSMGNIEWQKSLGGSDDDGFSSIIETSNNDLIIGGSTFSNDGDVFGNHGGTPNNDDIWLLRMNSEGNIDWQKCFGGTNIEWAPRLIHTSDDNFAFCAQTYSGDGDVVGNSNGSNYIISAWLVKLIAHEDVHIVTPTPMPGIFNKRLDFGFSCDGNSIVQALDGGFYIGGGVYSDTSKTSYRPLIAKTDSKGNPYWAKSINFSTASTFNAISPGSFGGIVATGYINDTNGYPSLLVVNIGDSGNIIWTFTGSNRSYAIGNSILHSKDGGYIIGIDDGDGDNYTVLKLNKYGDVQWSTRCVGTPNKIIQLKDDSYVMSATYYQGNMRGPFVLLKLSSSGNLIWSTFVEDDSRSQFVRTNILHTYDMTEISDGGFVVCGEKTRSIEIAGDPFVAKLDSAGKLVWITMADIFANARLETIREIGERDLIVSGNFITSRATGIDWMHPWVTDSLLMVRLHSNGEIYSVQLMSVPGISTEARQMITQADTTIIIVGDASKNNKQNGALLMKFDASLSAWNLFSIKAQDSIVTTHNTYPGGQGLLG
jgi:hypothetical protein